MKKMQQSVCALAVLAATTLPAMAASVDVRIVGTITPAACTPTLSGGGTVDYGAINPTTLSKTDFTVLPEKTVDIGIVCTAPAKVALIAVNGRPGTTAGVRENAITGFAHSPVKLLGQAGYGVAGLGLDGENKIGGYTLTLNDIITDGSSADVIYALDNRPGKPGGWAGGAAASGFGLFRAYGTVGFILTAADPGTLIPQAFTTFNGKLNVQAYLNNTSELDVSGAVNLDGLATIELLYL